MIEKNIVLVWVWWAGMSGIAGMLLDLGYTNIVWIDNEHSQLTDRLESRGLQIIYGHGHYKIQAGDIVIYSTATEQSLEVQQAYTLAQDYVHGMLVCSYFQFVGEISKYCRTLAIAGTNGKSTTTALALYAAQTHLADFWLWILGALVPDLGNQSYCIHRNHYDDMRNIFDHIFTGNWLNTQLIKKYIFILEACEYKRHFLHLDPDRTIITSLELDHTDYYRDMADYQDAFIQLINKTKQQVFLAPNMDRDRIPTQYQDKCLITQQQESFFDHVFGEHYQINTSLLHPALETMGMQWVTYTTRQGFHGIWRRMEYLGTTQQWASIYTDYAHMPSSLDMVYHTLKKQFPDKKICAVFQPHQVHRILQSWEEFVQAMRLYDANILYQIYAAREDGDKIYEYNHRAIGTVTDIWHILAKDIGSSYVVNFDRLHKLIQTYNADRIIVILTAGDLDYYIRNML